MRGFRFLLPLGLGALLLAGCCANNVCDCQDQLADALFFRFDTGPGGFVPRTELDTVAVRRYALPLDSAGRPSLRSLTPKNKKIKSFTDLADSLDRVGSFDLATLARSTAGRPNAVQTDTVVLNNTLPFAQSGARKLNAYLYRIAVRRAPGQLLRNNPRRYEVRDVALRGEFDGNGCCTCYRNTLKTATLANLATGNAQAVDATESTPAAPVYTTLTK